MERQGTQSLILSYNVNLYVNAINLNVNADVPWLVWANVSKVKSILDWSKAIFFYKCFIFENFKEGKKMYHQFHRSSLASVWVVHQGLSGHQSLYILSMSRFPWICSVIIAIWWVGQSTTCQVFRVGNTFPLKQKHTGRPWCGPRRLSASKQHICDQNI